MFSRNPGRFSNLAPPPLRKILFTAVSVPRREKAPIAYFNSLIRRDIDFSRAEASIFPAFFLSSASSMSIFSFSAQLFVKLFPPKRMLRMETITPPETILIEVLSAPISTTAAFFSPSPIKLIRAVESTSTTAGSTPIFFRDDK